MHLHDRLLDARRHLKPVQPKYVAVFSIGRTRKVLRPSPNWMVAALHGGILPPVASYLNDLNKPEGLRFEHPYAAPIGAMTEERAMEYLIQKDVPPAVWRDYRGNERVLAIVRADQVPTDRTYRDAWEIAE